MGVGFVVIAPQEAQSKIREASAKHNLKAYTLGRVDGGSRSVVMPFGDDQGQVVYDAP